jgi:RHH-type transcriptional regulator, proline utilization regulon repressor / proline dehydrogenase / delta 1-pyrroline-5-carboxylate dehydrogenase
MPLPAAITHDTMPDEAALLRDLVALAALPKTERAAIVARAADLVRAIRGQSSPGLMEVFLAEYGLSTDEGVALMCLAEALLRVPDAPTIDALIEDKISPADWGRHLGQSASSLVNASTWALMLTGRVLDDRAPGVVGHLRGAVKRLGEPVIRRAVGAAMKEMGRQFVLGETIDAAMTRARVLEGQGYTYSYDMLGEAARTEADARRYHLAYSAAISSIAPAATHGDICANPGISVKLSALHPRYEWAQADDVMDNLVPRLRALAGLAKAAGIGLNVDAEEADRLALSLQVIEATLSDPALKGWDGFGVVVQAYSRRGGPVIDWLDDLATRLDRKIMVRLVKGAYWDTEVKRAQVLGLPDYPVFTRKQATDVSYIALARKLLDKRARIYPQFATHNAHSVAAILHMAGNDRASFEFQRLHGMGEALHQIVHDRENTRCRIYAPVGAHRDLLAYLVRRLLENGANSSFVNQIVNDAVAPEQVAACPIAALAQPAPHLANGTEIFAPRTNARGFDLSNPGDLEVIEAARAPFMATTFTAHALLADGPAIGAAPWAVQNPATHAPVGQVTPASAADVARALATAQGWGADPATRADVLRRAADLYEQNFGLFFTLLAREAGKTLPDAVAELREAVDFLRYYADQARDTARGTFVCISPWNFPLAIFTGQIAAALAAGNAVLAKPAEQTSLIAHQAVLLLHQAGVPMTALQCLPGDGASVGVALTTDRRVAGVAFTGGTDTAQAIRRALAVHAPEAVLIAETGGLNAMIVDSTALAEQAVRDVVASSFQSAGQRCSALRCVYVQDDIAADFQHMLFGAMDLLRLGDPVRLTTDLGPLIDADAQSGVRAHINAARAEGRVLHELDAPTQGHFVAPTVIKVPGIHALEREVFGPVLHLATFKADALDRVIDAINATGYGLTFGLHTRIDARVQHVVERVRAGNIYVNRNQIGAVVGSQPFGGEGLSGTGPKAGGPTYLTRFCASVRPEATGNPAPARALADLQATIQCAQIPKTFTHVAEMPGPTGESNRLHHAPRGLILCLGPTIAAAKAQAQAVRQAGGVALEWPHPVTPDTLTTLHGIAAVVWWANPTDLQTALAARPGPLIPLILETPDASWVLSERHLCIDTTASGGNAQLLMQVAGA